MFVFFIMVFVVVISELGGIGVLIDVLDIINLVFFDVFMDVFINEVLSVIGIVLLMLWGLGYFG